MSKTELHKELEELKKDVLSMANLAVSMLADSIKALDKRDVNLANAVKDKDKKHKIREYDSSIETKALKLIALYQPMAIDLRRIAAILKMITYIYRIGRYGKDIAAVAHEIIERPVGSEILGIRHMWEHVDSMIKDSLTAFDSEDTINIKDFIERDSEIDQMRWSIFRETVSYMMENPNNITTSAHIIMIARYLERCADHACKIVEKVWYMVKGEHIEIS